MKLTVKYIRGTTQHAIEPLEVDGDMTVQQTLDLISTTFPQHIPDGMILKRLIALGKVLKDKSRTLSDFGVIDGTTMVVMFYPAKLAKLQEKNKPPAVEKATEKSTVVEKLKNLEIPNDNLVEAAAENFRVSPISMSKDSKESSSSGKQAVTTATAATTATTPSKEDESDHHGMMVQIPGMGQVSIDQVYQLMAVQMVNNPEMIRAPLMSSKVFAAIHKTNPEMCDQLLKNVPFLKELLVSQVLAMGPPGGFPGMAAAPSSPMPSASSGVAALALSDADEAAILQLMGLGSFPRGMVVQCYVACDRDMEKAATLLFQNMG